MAQIDASIPLGVRPVQMPDQMNALAKVMQIKGIQQEQALGQMKMDEYQRGVTEQNALRAALSAPDADPYNVLLRSGNVKGAMDWRKGQDESKKTAAETQKIDFDSQIKQVEHISSILSTARDPQSYEAARQLIGRQFPKALANMPAQFDPGALEGLIAQGQTITQRLTDQRAREQQAETGRHHRVSEGISAGQLGVARGNLGLRSQELDQARNQPRGQFIETTNGYVLADPKSGSVRPVMGTDGQPLKGKAADRSLNETQGKANLFGTRMREADRILGEVEGKYSPMAVNAKMAAADAPLVGGVAGYAGNLMLSEQGQLAEQAQRDFINAVLRRESGAAIAKSEFTNGQRQYFPQPGDSKDVLAQKKRNRQMAIQGLEVEVPGGFRGSPAPASTPQTGGATGDYGGAPKVGTTQDGYRFKGGNPADPKSWEKQ